MADTQEQDLKPIDNEDPEETPGYVPPAPKSLDEIQKLDADDESLNRYKKTLLGEIDAADAEGPNVEVQKMMFTVEGRAPQVLDLQGDLEALKKSSFTVKEGVEYRIKIVFRVKREIVSGLRFFQTTSRKGVTVDKLSLMVGSYGPKKESQEYLSPKEEAPKGMIARGHYKMKSRFMDDDKNIYLQWEWAIDIKKDWE